MFSQVRWALLRLGTFVFFRAIVSPQNTNPAADERGLVPDIRVDVNLRQVDLIVTDSKGNHVADLQPTDFELLENGRPQRISDFSWVEVTPPPSGARAAALQEKPSLLEKYSGAVRFRKTPGNDIVSAPVANLRKEEIRRVITILAHESTVPVMSRIRKFIDEQVGPGDMVSVRSTSRAVVPLRDSDLVQVRDAMGFFQQFTNDKRQLDAATERLPRVCIGRICYTDVPGAFAAAIQSLQSLPGRKALLFVGRYKGPVDDIIRIANRSGVLIYVLDPIGVVYEAEHIDDAVAPESERLLAEKTGGRRILSTAGFDLTAGLNEVIEDLSGYYLLAYHATDNSLTKASARHKIEVRVLRAGLTVRVRDGLMGTPNPAAAPDSTAPAQPMGREQILTKALFSAFTQDGVRVHLESLFAAQPPDRKKKRNPVVRAVLDIDGRDLTFADSDNAKKKSTVDVVVAVFDADGAQVGAVNKSFTLAISKEKAAELANSGLQYRLDVPLPRAGPYQVRAAVRDVASEEIGSTYSFVDIPDFNQPKISLSSIVLRLPENTPALPGARPEWNEFAAGATVQYFCEVFGLKTAKKAEIPPDVATEVKLYRGGRPVYDMPPSPVRIETVGNQPVLSGAMRIPSDLAVGNYMMEILAYDRLDSSKKKQTAKQWIDVTLVSP